MPEEQPGPPPAELVAEWGQAVDRIQAIQHLIRADIARSGVPAQWFAVLQLLFEAEDGRLPMSMIARKLAMTSGGFTKLADRMAREGLIDRRSASADRRVVYATLTDRGRERAETAARAYGEAVHSHVLRALDVADLHALADIARRLDAEPPSADESAGAEEQFVLEARPVTSPERRGQMTDAP